MSSKFLRKLFGLTQEELSDYFRIPLRTIQGWESKECMPSYVFAMMRVILWDVFFKLQKAYDESIDLEKGLPLEYLDHYKRLLEAKLKY